MIKEPSGPKKKTDCVAGKIVLQGQPLVVVDALAVDQEAGQQRLEETVQIGRRHGVHGEAHLLPEQLVRSVGQHREQRVDELAGHRVAKYCLRIHPRTFVVNGVKLGTGLGLGTQ